MTADDVSFYGLMLLAACLIWMQTKPGRDRRKAERARRQQLLWDAEIDIALALTGDTPIHDQLGCDHFRRQLDHPDAATRIGEGA